ncbi:MAG: CoA pyrophosphatase [Dehalococcoidales bacterium]|nr:MAG: CoA pyrophosphatase [Dehalococcoidales bacterium]
MEQKLRQALTRRQKLHISDPHRVSSAVLIPIYRKHGQPHILFIQRTDRVRDHKGQISFPGGAYEEGDENLLQTALRESTEEVGIMAEDVEVLGELDDYRTIGSNYVISPFVAGIPWPYQFKVDEWETEGIIEVPISTLLDESNVRRDKDILEGEEIDQYYYHYQDKVIWGATARILKQLLDILADVPQDEKP